MTPGDFLRAVWPAAASTASQRRLSSPAATRRKKSTRTRPSTTSARRQLRPQPARHQGPVLRRPHAEGASGLGSQQAQPQDRRARLEHGPHPAEHEGGAVLLLRSRRRARGAEIRQPGRGRGGPAQILRGDRAAQAAGDFVRRRPARLLDHRRPAGEQRVAHPRHEAQATGPSLRVEDRPSRTTDTASVLRVAGTFNFKDRSTPREVKA
jgi:hypothetical protein